MSARNPAHRLRRGARLGACALLFGLAACEARPDEAWLHVTGFKDGANEVSFVETALADGTTKSVTVGLENGSDLAGTAAGGVAILVKRARVSYSGHGAAFPTYEYPTALYLPGPEAGKTTTGSVTVPVAPAQLKAWILGSGSLPAPPFQVSAMVTILADTEEGRELETTAGLSVIFK